LRSPEDFDSLDIEYVQKRALGAAEINVVEIDADARIGEGETVELPGAPNIGDGVLRVAFVQSDVWRRGLDVADFDRVEPLELAGRHRPLIA
jgi:hypothetical protein